MKKSVLLVDDEQDILDTLKIGLEPQFEVRTARSGKGCLEAVQMSRPDIIVMDVMMDHMSDGFDTAKTLKSNPETKNIPVILLTGVNDHYDYRSQADEAFYPRDKFLEKPVKPEVLIREMEALLSACSH